MKVSVIVPVYNVEQYLARCLDSILAQTYHDYEIICVNDCSPDNSSAILSEYASKHPDRIKVITNEVNLGLGLSREKALEVACGEFVCLSIATTTSSPITYSTISMLQMTATTTLWLAGIFETSTAS